MPSNSDGPGRDLEDPQQIVNESSMKLHASRYQDILRIPDDPGILWKSTLSSSFFNQASQSCRQQVHARLDQLDHTQCSLLEKAHSCFDLSCPKKAVLKSVEDLF